MMKQRIKDAAAVLCGKKLAIDKNTSMIDIVRWKYDIIAPSYKQIYSIAADKLKDWYDLALRMSIGFQI